MDKNNCRVIDCESEKCLLNVLFVDDENLSQAIAERHLKKLGCSINFAALGEEAIIDLKENDYDIVFLDFFLPDMNATEVVGEIRKSTAVANCFFVGITNDGSSSCRNAFAEVGVVEVLEKPLTITVLEQIVNRVKQYKLNPASSNCSK